MMLPGHVPLKKLDLPDPFAPTATHRRVTLLLRGLLTPTCLYCWKCPNSLAIHGTHEHTNDIDVLIKGLRNGLVFVALVALDDGLHAKA